MTHRQKNWTDRYAPKFGQLSLNNSPFHSQQSTFSSPSQQLLGTLLSLLPFTKYLPSIRHPNSCIVVWQQQICWLVLLPILSMLPIGCLWFTNTGVFVDLFLRRWHNRLCYVQCHCGHWRPKAWTDFSPCCWDWDTKRLLLWGAHISF